MPTSHIPMIVSRRIELLIVATTAFVALGIVVGLWVTDTFRGDATTLIPNQTPQLAAVSEGGIELSVSSASFSGTRTLLSLSVAIQPSVFPEVREVRATAFAQDSVLPKSGQAIILARGLNAPNLLELRPITLNGQARLHITELVVVDGRGAQHEINGDWLLPLEVPKDLAALLEVELLASPAVAVTTQGVEVSFLGGRRSTSETTVTIRVAAATGQRVLQVGEPLLLAGGGHLTGTAREMPDGTTNLRFPPTEFGSPVEVLLGPFGLSSGVQEHLISMDLTSAIDAGRLSEPKDAVDSAAETSGRVLQVALYDLGTKVLRFTLPGNREPGFQATVVLSDGRVVSSAGSNTIYGKDDAGAIHPGTTTVDFEVDSIEDWRGSFELSDLDASQFLQGPWRLTLEGGDRIRPQATIRTSGALGLSRCA